MSSMDGRLPLTVSRFDERQWVVQIRQTLDEEHEEDIDDVPVSIFSVPNALLVSDPDSYIPQQVPIGPYHYWRPEMYEMERYKLAAARTMQQHLKTLKFHDVVEQLRRLEPLIRACYHKNLTCNGETLAWMMAVDACFLLEFLQIYAVKEDKLLHSISSKMSHLVDISGRKSAHNAILRDLAMLENQIPLFLLRKMLEVKFSSLEMADNLLFSMLMSFSKVISPFKKMEELPKLQAMESAHLLDFLYHSFVPKLQKRPSELTEPGESNEGKEEGVRNHFQISRAIKKLLHVIWKISSKLEGPFRIIKKICFDRVTKILTKLPWEMISNLPGMNLMKGPIESLVTQEEEEDKNPEDDDEVINNNDKPPLVEEILIPSVSDLSKVHVNFIPTKGGILSMKFDEKSRTFYLPSVSLDVNTAAVFRNLVAFEACKASGPVIFTRYTELMNGIIDTKEDAKILREKGIILNRLKSDEEVAKLWNGMSRCVRLTKAPHLEKVIEDVNRYYNGRWKVKAVKFMKAYVYGSWQFLTFLACVILLLLMILQAFCSVYTCERVFRISPN